MDWSAFYGALAGTLLTLLLAAVVIIVLGYLGERKSNRAQPSVILTAPSEKSLQKHLASHFDIHFPGWEFIGCEHPIRGKKIDILCRDEAGNFVVIELKKNKPPYHVVQQTGMYMAYIREDMAEPHKKVRGLIIANQSDEHVESLLKDKPDMEFWTYELRLEFKKSRVSANA